MVASRRKFIKYASAAPVAIGAMASALPVFSESASANVTRYAQIGSITGTDPAGYVQFADWLGRKPGLALLAFNQYSASALSSSINWCCQQSAGFIAAGTQILWSVPCPGARQLEAIVAGNYDSLYFTLFRSILAVTPAYSTRILVRLPWEFNLDWQENAAIDKSGNINPPLFIAAWRRIALIAKAVSPYFYRIWCPALGMNAVDAALCWPGAGYVEYVSQDFYMQSAIGKAGEFHRARDNVRGLQWCADFALTNGKRYGLSEWGMDSDIFVEDLNSAAAWMASLGNNFNHHCWWDRPEVIDCRISDGTHPGLAAAYKANFF